MKKLLLASLVSALSVTAAHAAPKVYGKLFVAVDYTNQKDAAANGDDLNTWTLSSNASRFGIKGEDELTPTLSAIYQAEWGIQATSDDGKADLSSRNRYLGVKSTQFGALKFGRFDTALKESQNKVDLFNDMVGESADMKSVLTGENRVNRVIGWEAPELEGLPVKATLNLVLDQGANGKNGDNGFSGMVAYDQGGIYAALAADQKVVSSYEGILATPTTPVALATDTIRVVGQFDLAKLMAGPAVTLGALYQTSQPSETNALIDQQDAWLISANVKLPESVGTDALGLFLQYQQSETSLNVPADDLKRTQFGGGISYAFSKNTAVYGYLAQQKFDSVSAAGVFARDQKTNILGTALEHKF